MRRRDFILTLTGTLACLHYLYTPGVRARSQSGRIEDQYATMFSDPDNARVVGRVYLQANPRHANRAYLQRQLGEEHSQDPIKSFENRRQQDFLNGNTVAVDGWVLANAEVCVCALLALSAV